MKRMGIAILAVVLFASAAYGTLYNWNPNKRPPISLPEALQRAEKLLGDDAKNRYCTSVVLYGNEAGDGKECGWNMIYSATDGSQKLVHIDETGAGSVQQWAAGPVEWFKKPDRCTGLDDIVTRLNKVLEDNGYTQRATVQDGNLTLNARTRTFQVYPRTESGAFGKEFVEVVGPQYDGIMIEARETSHPDFRWANFFSRLAEYYWQVERGNYVLTGKDRFVSVEMRHGEGVPDSLIVLLWQAFGARLPGFFG